MAKKITYSPEELKERQLSSEKNDVEERISKGIIPKNPTRLFKAGDFVRWGNHQNVVVVEVLFDGLAYHLHYDYMGKEYGMPKRQVSDSIQIWSEVFPTTLYSNTQEPLSIQDDIRINYFNNDISSLLHKVYDAGVDFNPDYQRDLVWTQQQKTNLLDSIFNNVEIGKFTFIKHDYSRQLYYEILDGKQRLSTICEFYEDRLTWKGLKFTELCFKDAHHFTSFPIVQGEVSQLSQQQIYKLFVKMNTSGTPVSQEHLDKIKSLIV
jgi:Protein of unknown function DUF262